MITVSYFFEEDLLEKLRIGGVKKDRTSPLTLLAGIDSILLYAFHFGEGCLLSEV
jgi:hypothetical protein